MKQKPEQKQLTLFMCPWIPHVAISKYGCPVQEKKYDDDDDDDGVGDGDGDGDSDGDGFWRLSGSVLL